MKATREFGRGFQSYSRGNTRGGIRAFPALIWLGFILFPLVDAITTHASPVGKALTIAGAAVFVGSYLALVLMWRQRPWHPKAIALFALLLGTAIALTLASGPGWGFLFTYCAAVVALFSSAQVGWLWVSGCAILAAGSSAIAGASGGAVITYAVTALGIGLLMALMRDLRVRNEELNAARAELADAAVARERERFARDLHDLLGHSLSVIALKAELAGRLLPGRPEQAATEVAEVEQVARQALSEVRLAVSGYRQPTLEGELAGARMALAAAGIEAHIKAPKVTLQPDVEAVLAWAVREGATNAIRHSRARKCTIRVVAGLADASVEVVDDGGAATPGEPAGAQAGHGAQGERGARGARAARAGARRALGGEGGEPIPSAARPDQDHRGAGNGLAGLRERAEALHGHVEAGTLPGGGFRLMVSVPTSPASSASPAPASASAIGSGVVVGSGVLVGRGRPRSPVRLPGECSVRLIARRAPGLAGAAMIRVLIAEDQGMVRGALASLLELEPDIDVVAQVPRGDEVVEAALAAKPDVALLDIEMPGATGLEAAEQLRSAAPDTRVLILTTFGRPGYLRRAMEGGAAGFLLKDAPASELASAIRRAVSGERVVDPGLAAAALSQGESPLTPREHEVLAASRDHATVADLAKALYLSPGTVRNHLSSVMQKLDARNRAEALRVAEERGWL